jgi:hypothetical protein
MPVSGDFVTVAALGAALADDIDPDTPVVVATAGTERLLWITEITLNAMQSPIASTKRSSNCPPNM